MVAEWKRLSSGGEKAKADATAVVTSNGAPQLSMTDMSMLCGLWFRPLLNWKLADDQSYVVSFYARSETAE